ncbi:unnamed protein product [Periconia digitata]|uniref:Uncharacterized protein n=1 Tax=Periconia digitata TaxID=1303443 RepID=A0A9W4UC88_9PLEO|nr:unnamed protein product [Periconia digitata]
MDSFRNKASGFLNGPIFNPALKTKMHCLTILLVVIVIVVTGVRIQTKPKGIPVTRSDTISIVMGAKTLVFLLYQIITTHVAKFHRWQSLRAYLIMNTLEILFWSAVVILTFMGVARLCVGTHCGLGWVTAVLAIALV